MTGHDWLVLSHVLAAIVLVGGVVAFSRVMGQRVIHSGDGGQVARFAQIIQWTGVGVYEPVSPLVTGVDA